MYYFLYDEVVSAFLIGKLTTTVSFVTPCYHGLMVTRYYISHVIIKSGNISVQLDYVNCFIAVLVSISVVSTKYLYVIYNSF